MQAKPTTFTLADFLTNSIDVPDLLDSSTENQPPTNNQQPITRYTVKYPQPSFQQEPESEPIDVSQQPAENPNQPIQSTDAASLNTANDTCTNKPTTKDTTSDSSTLNVWHKSKTLSKCYEGAILEIETAADIQTATPTTEVRVKPELLRKLKNASVSTKNFGWNLVKLLFSPNEIVGRNFNGNKGKQQLSPRRRHAVEHGITDMYGEDMIQTPITGINKGLRNYLKK